MWKWKLTRKAPFTPISCRWVILAWVYSVACCAQNSSDVMTCVITKSRYNCSSVGFSWSNLEKWTKMELTYKHRCNINFHLSIILRQIHIHQYLFFSSSSLLTFLLNFGRSCCRSSFTWSRSLTCASCPLLFTKWNVDDVLSWRTTCSWIFDLPSGDIFCTAIFIINEEIFKERSKTNLKLSKWTSYALYPHIYDWLTPCLCYRASMQLFRSSRTMCHHLSCNAPVLLASKRLPKR